VKQKEQLREGLVPKRDHVLNKIGLVVRASACVCVRERECVNVCERACVCVRERVCECVCVRMCVRESVYGCMSKVGRITCLARLSSWCVRVYAYLYVYVSPYTCVVCVSFIDRAVGVSILSVELLV
jgi:hypothetical protein